MAQDKKYNEQTGQYEDPVENPNNVGTGTGVAPPTSGPGWQSWASGYGPNDAYNPDGTPKNAWDSNKNGTAKSYNPFDRTNFRDSWMSQGAGYGGDVMKFITDQGYDPSGFQSAGNNNGAWRLPTGEVMDLVGDKGGKNSAEWTGAGYMTNPGGPIQQYAGGGGGSGGNTPAGNGATQGSSSSYQTTAAAPGTSDLRNQLLAQLMQRSQQGLNVDPNDPIIKGQTDAYNAQQDRVKRQYLSNLAETSGGSANISAETRHANEQTGQAGAAFQAQLMGRELQSRRDEIQNALTQEGSMLSNEQQMGLTKELALMDDAIKRLGLQQSNNQFYSGLGSQNDQFAARLGFDTADRASYWDALRRGLING